MPLDNTCKLVLGHNWLKNHNPSINWQQGTVNLPKPKCEELPTSNKPEQPYPTESHHPTPRKPDISLINAVAYRKACKVEGAIMFQLQPSREPTLSSQASQIIEPTPKLNKIPEEYHEYLEVFSKTKAKTLPTHRPYDLTIQLEEDTTPPLRLIYSLSTLELQTLQEFINENLQTGFI